jgi:predicted lipid carrier protein YhbT
MATATKTTGQGPTEAFFGALAERAHEPALGRVTGTVRCDVTERDGTVEHWYVTIKKGDVKVSNKSGAADAVVRADRKLFDGFASGNENVTAALLRGVLDIEGDLQLLSMFQRVFPGPPRTFPQSEVKS